MTTKLTVATVSEKMKVAFYKLFCSETNRKNEKEVYDLRLAAKQTGPKCHRQLQDLTIGDKVLIRVHSERFPLKTLKKLHTQRRGPYNVLKKFGFSAYELDILREFEASRT